jgi:hypothetical protein
LYGTEPSSWIRTTSRVGVKYTIKDGIIYDARKLLADVRRMVANQDREEGNHQLTIDD